jgi:hypothetical protein
MMTIELISNSTSLCSVLNDNLKLNKKSSIPGPATLSLNMSFNYKKQRLCPVTTEPGFKG